MHLNFSVGCNLSSLFLWDGTWTCAPGFLPLFLVPHLHTFPIASCKCKGQTEKGKSRITGCLSNLVLHHACFKWEHSKRCAVSSLELLTLLFSLEWNPTSHVPLFLWHPLCKQCVRKRQTKRLQERMKPVYKCLFFPRSSQWSDKILMVVYPESCRELMKALLRVLLPFKQIEQLVTVSSCYLFAF